MVVPIYEGKGDAVKCGSFKGIKLLEYAMKFVVRVLEKRLQDKTNLEKLQYEFMPGKEQFMLFFY